MMSIGIFGSCVSRDTCEFIADSVVTAYVARQSSIVSLAPVGDSTFSTEQLDSAFQARMFEGDQKADSIERIISAEPDLIFIDLVDERDGVWKFPNGEFLTNSIEAYRAGVKKWAPQAGARLVRFGSDEHFTLWASAFSKQMEKLDNADLLGRVIFLDIEWASAQAGQPHPSRGVKYLVGRHIRRLRRRFRLGRRKIQRGESLRSSFFVGQELPETQAESFARRACQANLSRKRYVSHIDSIVENKVVRTEEYLRIDGKNKWGAEPYHYREADYTSIANEIIEIAQGANDE